MTNEEKKEKKRLANKKYKDKNKDLIKQKSKEYYDNKKEVIKENYKLNKEKELERAKKYREENKEKITQKRKEWRELNKEKVKEYRKKHNKTYSEKNKDKRNIKRKEKLKNDEVFRLKESIRSSINKIINKNGLTKITKTELILGCSFEEFKQYIETKFEPWMNWDNYGLYNGELNYGWDIDHIIPLSTIKTVEELIKLNHFTNLQPLCSYINRVIKSNKVIN
jgi:hypothetical protein